MQEEDQVARLKRGDEAAFRALVEQLHGRLQAVARAIVRSDALAEEAVQDGWLAVIRGIHGFEGRSALGTWIYSIVVNRARSVAAREHREAASATLRSDASSAAAEDDPGENGPEMGPRGMWEVPPPPWSLEDPEGVMLRREVQAVVEQALGRLPEAQRLVVLLRDVEGLASQDACNILGVSETNQRVLLHRARRKVRRAVDDYLRS